MKVLKGTAGALLILFGLLGASAAAIEIADPVGAKMTDDSQPFGRPAPLTQSVTLLGAYGAVAVAGICLLPGRRQREVH